MEKLGKFKIILIVLLLIAILVASFCLYKNIKTYKSAASYSKENLNSDISNLEKDKSLDELYLEINSYIDKVEKIGQEANTKENHGSLEKVEYYIEKLDEIEKDIEENHQDFQGHDSYVILMNRIEAGKEALTNQKTLLELEKDK